MSKKKPDETLLDKRAREVSRRKDEVVLNSRHFVTAVAHDESIKALGRNAATAIATAVVGAAVGAIFGGRRRAR